MVGKVLDMVSFAVACVKKALPCTMCLVCSGWIHAVYVVFTIVVPLQVRSGSLIDDYDYQNGKKQRQYVFEGFQYRNVPVANVAI